MTDTTTEVDSENTEAKKPVKEIPVVQDQGFFQHDTGDTYDGFFEAKKKDRVAKMHGPGLYTTVEGDTYMGTWDADKLGGNDEVTVAFTDGSRYEGFFKDWSYSGRGRPERSHLVGQSRARLRLVRTSEPLLRYAGEDQRFREVQTSAEEQCTRLQVVSVEVY
ncbi:uncharacterized protein LOC114360125 isoform X4 [Ostrinia furnacalis]|nr:uncharacterized protein LOC114360125 isoform X4 [Ostrinia furnacalis]